MSLRQLSVKHIRPNHSYGVHVLKLNGFINARTNQEFETAIEKVLNGENADLVLDLENLKYLNSTGLSTLIHYQKLFNERQRELALIKIPHHVAIVIHQMGLAEVVPILRDEGEANKYLEKRTNGNRVFENWQNFIEKTFPEKRKTPVQRKLQKLKGKHCVLLIEPKVDEFAAVLKLRLHNPNVEFFVASDEREAIKFFKEYSPEIVMIRHTGLESDHLILKMKTDLNRPLMSVTKIYNRGTRIDHFRDFKIWENDYFTEPFNIFELFTLAESELIRIKSERQLGRHQLNYRFASDETQIDKAAELTKQLIKQSGLDHETNTRLLSAYNEAIDNAYRHGHQKKTHKLIDVVYTADKESISIMITDQGKGFDHKAWTHGLKDTSAVKRTQKARSRGQKGGLGILLMFKCCSRVSYLANGNTVLLEQKIDL